MLNRTSKRIEEMKEIHEEYFFFLNNFLFEKKKDANDKDVSDMIENFAIDKIASKPSSRAHLMYLIAKTLNIEINKSFFFVCASLELIMVQAYCYNVGADGKSGYVGDKKQVAFKTADFLKKNHNEFIDNTDLLNKEQKESLKKFTFDIYKAIYIGQVFDTLININTNLYKEKLFPINPQKNLELDMENLKEEYFFVENSPKLDSSIDLDTIENFIWKRTYGLSGYMNEIYSQVFSEIFLDKKECTDEVNHLKNFCFCYGMLLMIVNDIQDFSLDLTNIQKPTREKDISDVFIDIKNERITYPIYKLVEKSDPEDLMLMDNFYRNKNDVSLQERIREIMVKKGYIKSSLLDASAYAFMATDSLKFFEKDENISMLNDLVISLVKGNKYVKFLSEKYDCKIKSTDSEIKNKKRSLSEWILNNKKDLSQIFN